MGDRISIERGAEYLDRAITNAKTPNVRTLQPATPRATPGDSGVRLRPLTVAEIRAMPAPPWLVREIVQSRSLLLVYGASGSGKTFLMLDLALGIARGCRWFDCRVRQGGVIYIATEGHLKLRLDAYMQHNGLTDAELTPFRALSTSLNLLDPDADLAPLLEALREAANDMGGVAFVVLDTLNAMMAGGEENSSQDMGRMVAVGRRIMETLDCTVAYVHHGGKDEDRGARGHSCLRAAVDSEIKVKDDKGQRVATITKQRDGHTGTDLFFRLVPVDLGPAADPDADPDERDGSCIVEQAQGAAKTAYKPPRRDVALDALREALEAYGEVLPGTSTIPPGVRAVRLEKWLSRWRLRTGDDYGSDASAGAAFRRERRKLIDTSQVDCSGRYAWLCS
jgi:putative DNA primase/helicase